VHFPLVDEYSVKTIERRRREGASKRRNKRKGRGKKRKKGQGGGPRGEEGVARQRLKSKLIYVFIFDGC